jgi:hypothetical protein
MPNWCLHEARKQTKPSLSRSREARSKHVYTDPYQAALLKTFFMPACIGAAISVVSFCAMPVRCRPCSANGPGPFRGDPLPMISAGVPDEAGASVLDRVLQALDAN